MKLGGWKQRPERERRILIAGGVAAVLLLGYGSIWLPLAKSRQALREQLASAEADLAWMRQVAPHVRSPEAVAPLATDNRSLLARVDAEARAANLGTSLLRVEPVTENEVRVYFQHAPFDELVGWLEKLTAQQGIELRELSIQRVEGVGLIDARFLLTQVHN